MQSTPLSVAPGSARMTSHTESNWVVLKFGGTSVSSVSNWKNVAGVVKARLVEGLHPVIVHSALSGITDRLEQLLAKALTGEWEPVMDQIERRHLDLARDLGIHIDAELDRHFTDLRRSAEGIHLIGEVSDRLRARVMANGELMATRIGAAFLQAEGIDVQWLDARTLLHAEERPGATERANYLSATCNFEPDTAFQQRLASGGKVLITQGFIASDARGDTVLLGRGGSDTSGSYFAAKLGARRLEIWTDVPGMFTSNPKSVSNARLLKSLDYDEAQEIASSGAKVLHPRCILPVKQYAIPLTVHATQQPELEGTVVTATGGDGGARVKAVCIKKGITLLSLETLGMWHQVGFLADAFAVFKEHGLSVDLVSTSETSVTVSLDPAANSLDSRTLEALVTALSQAVPRRSDRALRGREPRRPQHPRHAAPAGRCARTVRGAAHLPGHAGRERPQHHVRRRRRAGRSSRAPTARRHRLERAVRPRAGPHVGADPRSRSGAARRRTAVVAGPPRRTAAHRARARQRVRLRPRVGRARGAAVARHPRRRPRLLCDEGQPASGAAADLCRDWACRSNASRAANASA